MGNLSINLDKGVTWTKNITITVPEQVHPDFRFYVPTKDAYWTVSSK